MQDKERDNTLSDKEVIRNLKNDLRVTSSLYAQYRQVTEAQLASQNTAIASLIKEKEELKLLASETIPLLIRLGDFIGNTEHRCEIILKLKHNLGIIDSMNLEQQWLDRVLEQMAQVECMALLLKKTKIVQDKNLLQQDKNLLQYRLDLCYSLVNDIKSYLNKEDATQLRNLYLLLEQKATAALYMY